MGVGLDLSRRFMLLSETVCIGTYLPTWHSVGPRSVYEASNRHGHLRRHGGAVQPKGIPQKSLSEPHAQITTLLQVDNQGIPYEEMRAIVANLCVDEVELAVSDPEYYNFDVAISTLAFHHFDNVPLAIRRVVERLRPKTGVLLIIDFRTHKPIQFGRHEHQHQHHHQEKHHDAQSKPLGFHGGTHTVAHSGFSEEEIKRWYKEAGLVDVEIVDVGPGTGITIFGGGPDTGEENKLRRAVFMAKGRRG